MNLKNSSDENLYEQFTFTIFFFISKSGFFLMDTIKTH